MQLIRTLIWFVMVGMAYSATHHPQDFLASVKGKPDEAKNIYQQFCANCHNPKPMLPLGAPQIGDKNAWKQRLLPGFDVIFKHTLEGKGLMPARGGCFECSDEQLELIVKYMINHKK